MPCPECSGLSQPGHPHGELAGWHHAATCALLVGEDSRAVADDQQLDRRSIFLRDATLVERTLLTALGRTPRTWATTVRADAGGRHRSWPADTPEETAA